MYWQHGLKHVITVLASGKVQLFMISTGWVFFFCDPVIFKVVDISECCPLNLDQAYHHHNFVKHFILDHDHVKNYEINIS